MKSIIFIFLLSVSSFGFYSGLGTDGVQIGFGAKDGNLKFGLSASYGFFKAKEYDSHRIGLALPFSWLTLRFHSLAINFVSVPFAGATLYTPLQTSTAYLDSYSSFDIGITVLRLEPEVFVSDRISFYVNADLLGAGFKSDIDSDSYYLRILGAVSPTSNMPFAAFGFRYFF